MLVHRGVHRDFDFDQASMDEQPHEDDCSYAWDACHGVVEAECTSDEQGTFAVMDGSAMAHSPILTGMDHCDNDGEAGAPATDSSEVSVACAPASQRLQTVTPDTSGLPWFSANTSDCGEVVTSPLQDDLELGAAEELREAEVIFIDEWSWNAEQLQPTIFQELEKYHSSITSSRPYDGELDVFASYPSYTESTARLLKTSETKELREKAYIYDPTRKNDGMCRKSKADDVPSVMNPTTRSAMKLLPYRHPGNEMARLGTLPFPFRPSAPSQKSGASGAKRSSRSEDEDVTDREHRKPHNPDNIKPHAFFLLMGEELNTVQKRNQASTRQEARQSPPSCLQACKLKSLPCLIIVTPEEHQPMTIKKALSLSKDVRKVEDLCNDLVERNVQEAVAQGRLTGGDSQRKQYQESLQASLNRILGQFAQEQQWADKVFRTGYQRISWQAVINHIKQFGHLPWIRSEAEVLERGIDLEKDHVNLLEAVENLYLYLHDYIQQENRLIDDVKLHGMSKKQELDEIRQDSLTRMLRYLERSDTTWRPQQVRTQDLTTGRVESALSDAQEIQEVLGPSCLDTDVNHIANLIKRKTSATKALELAVEARRRVDSGESSKNACGCVISPLSQSCLAVL